MLNEAIEIYTDGSCHTQLRIGAWAAILFIDQKKIVLKGTELDTTHNNMELLAVIRAIQHVSTSQAGKKIIIYSDSQYVVNIPARKEKLKTNSFYTKKKNPIKNTDLVQSLILQIETHNIEFIKIKAHQKEVSQVNYNREVDMLVRKVLRKS